MISLDEAIQNVVLESEKPAKAIASETGISYKYLLNAANPHEEATQFQARMIVPVTLCTGNDAIVRSIAEGVGGMFVRLPKVGDGPTDLINAISDLAREFGDSMRVVGEGIADRQLDAREADAADFELSQLIERALAMRELVRLHRPAAGKGAQ